MLPLLRPTETIAETGKHQGTLHWPRPSPRQWPCRPSPLLSCFQNKKQRRHSPSQKHSQGRWRRHMCTTRSFSRKIAQPPCQLPLKSLHPFRVMDPFDWTMDKNVYQRWQLWSHKARLTLDAMEGDTEKTKISYLHHLLNGEGIAKIEGWRNSKILPSQADYDALEEIDKVGKYSLDKIESYFSWCGLVLTPRSNPLLTVEDLYLAKQGSMTSGEFHSHILKIVKRCQFPCQEAEERAVRDTIFMGMNSQ